MNFNAWANDIESDAFIGIMNEFLVQLKSSDVEKIAEFRESVVDCIGAFFQTVLFTSSKINGFINDLKSSRDKARSRSDNHVYATDIVPSAVDLREKLTACFKSFRENCLCGDKKEKIVVLIDELDRCRPDYAIEVLERIKHLFPLENFVFIFAISKSQLEKSVQHVFGDIDAFQYLKRFFDYQLLLPLPELDEYCSMKNKNWSDENMRVISQLMTVLLLESREHISLRDVNQMYDKLDLFAAFFNKRRNRLYGVLAAVLIIGEVSAPDFTDNYFVNHTYSGKEKWFIGLLENIELYTSYDGTQQYSLLPVLISGKELDVAGSVSYKTSTRLRSLGVGINRVSIWYSSSEIFSMFEELYSYSKSMIIR